MLLESEKHSARDLEEWRRLERYDETLAASPALERRTRRAIRVMEDFAKRVDCYVGVSWGKDSVVVAHLASLSPALTGLPLVWVRVDPISNPDCEAVRDAYLASSRQPYHEITTHCTWSDGEWHATGTLEEGFARAKSAFGEAHVSGVRSDESNMRKLRTMRWGESSKNTCAPIARWSGLDVFAYLYKHNLPIHPAYAMSFGGMTPRERLRVASLGGKRGTGMGRRQWEWHYYPEKMHELGISRP